MSSFAYCPATLVRSLFPLAPFEHWSHELRPIPGVADAAGIGGGIDAGTPVGFGGAATGGDVLVFPGRQGRGFLDADQVVFETD